MKQQPVGAKISNAGSYLYITLAGIDRLVSFGRNGTLSH